MLAGLRPVIPTRIALVRIRIEAMRFVLVVLTSRILSLGFVSKLQIGQNRFDLRLGSRSPAYLSALLPNLRQILQDLFMHEKTIE
jgi:hypothetical protein